MISDTNSIIFKQSISRFFGTVNVLGRLEALAYVIFGAGAVADQLSTGYALSFAGIYETNPVVAQVMKLGLWPVFDAAILLATILTCMTIMRRWNFTNKWVSLIFPMVIGGFRLGAALWNVSLVI